MKYFWKIYSTVFLIVIVSIFVLGLLFFGGQWQHGFLKSVILLFIIFSPIIGLIGFAWRKPLGWMWIWKFMSCVFIFCAVFELIGRVIDIVNQDESCFGAWCFVIEPLLFTLGLPLIIGLYQYAFRSPGIWERKY